MTDQQPRLQPLDGRLGDQRRLLDKIEIDENGCWRWQGGKIASRGSKELVYGNGFQLDGRSELAHRAAYKLWVGEITKGLVIDHLCGVKDCANPAHLEAVTPFENLQRSGNTWVGQNSRKTHCPAGHEYTPENTRVMKRSMGRDGFGRACKECARIQSRARAQVGVQCTSCDFRGKRTPTTCANPCPKCAAPLEVTWRREAA